MNHDEPMGTLKLASAPWSSSCIQCGDIHWITSLLSLEILVRPSFCSYLSKVCNLEVHLRSNSRGLIMYHLPSSQTSNAKSQRSKNRTSWDGDSRGVMVWRVETSTKKVDSSNRIPQREFFGSGAKMNWYKSVRTISWFMHYSLIFNPGNRTIAIWIVFLPHLVLP